MSIPTAKERVELLNASIADRATTVQRLQEELRLSVEDLNEFIDQLPEANAALHKERVAEFRKGKRPHR
jgi:septal ring factor EnvC (AmiA/AmiB activator)